MKYYEVKKTSLIFEPIVWIDKLKKIYFNLEVHRQFSFGFVCLKDSNLKIFFPFYYYAAN